MGSYQLRHEERHHGWNFTGAGFLFLRHYDYQQPWHFEIDLHQHDWHEFVWCRCPEPTPEPYEYVLDGISHTIRNGTLLYAPPFHAHSFRIRGPLENWIVGIDQTLVRKMFSYSPIANGLDSLFGSWRDLPAVRHTPESWASQALALDGLFAATRSTGTLDSLEALHLLVSLDRIIAPWKCSDDPGNPQESSRSNLVSSALDFLEKNFSRSVGVDDCARHIGVARSTLSHHFKALTGQSIPQRLNEVRLRHAQAMLVETNLDIIEIALECGFNDQAWFSRQFRAQMGVSPSVWRSRSRSLLNSANSPHGSQGQ